MTKSYAEQAGILVFGRMLTALSEALVPIIIVRLLLKEDFGILASLLVIYMTISTVLMTGFPQTILFYLPARAPAERRAIAWKVTSTLFFLGLLTAVVLAALPLINWLDPDLLSGIIGSEPGKLAINPSTLRYLFVLSFLPLADLPGRVLPNLLVVEGRAKAAAGVSVFHSVGGAIAIILPMALGFDLWVVIISLSAFGYLYGTVLLVYLFFIYRGVPRMPSPVSYRELFRFGVPLGLTEIVAKLNGYVDRYLIIIMFSAAVFAEYHAAAWQIPVITTIAYTVGTAYSPKFAELFKAGRPLEAITIWRQTMLKVALIVVPLATIFIVAAEESIELFFTEDYLRGANVFRYYALITLGRITAFGTIMVAAGKPRFVLLAASMSLFANVIISVPLVLGMGFEGPALGSLLAFVAMVVFYCWCIARATGLRFKEIFPLLGYLRVLGLVAAASIPAIVFKVMVQLPAAPKLGIIALIVIAAFSLLGTLLGQIKSEDWRYLGNWLSLKFLR